MRIIAGLLGGRTLKTVEGPGYRPAMSRVREALFSMLESRGVVWSGCRVLDAFAGSGSLAFECISRGAREAVLVENGKEAIRCLQKNAQTLGLATDRLTDGVTESVMGRVRIVHDDVLKFLKIRASQCFDVVFIDPPYGKNLLAPTLQNLLRQGWVAEHSFVTAEVEAALPYDGNAAHPRLELLTERTFGQTRIVIWKVKPNA